ncbi:MAG: prepilin-type N-terminal cleavage/methylation domain-containing protein [Planctomycetes bacterium]|nr:prepilin-type N-terminal cleavage/methylation domain-containing protein [Planctomycetota bacterium]
MTRHPLTRRAGFTLVEVLIVITILGMLMALTVVGISKALDTARQAKITTDLSQLDTALGTYKTDRNDFPPALFPVTANFNTAGAVDSTDPGQVYNQVRFNRHVRQAFSRYRGGDPYTAFGLLVRALNVQKQTADPPGPPDPIPLDIYDLDPAESLVLWLGGISDSLGSLQNYSGSNKLIGFSSDPAHPFGIYDSSSNTLTSFTQPKGLIYPFDPQRLVDRDNDGWLEYAVDFRADKAEMPGYAYFDFRGYTRPGPGNTQIVNFYSPTPAHEVAVPYASGVSASNTVTWVNAQKFQLIAAGLDGTFGNPDTTVLRVFPIGTGYGEGDDDNLVNFTTSALRTEMEKQ